MNTIKNIRIKEDNGCLVTIGLKRFIGKEFKITKLKQDELEYQSVLGYLIDHILDVKPVINDGQTIAYHSWLLKFIYEDDLIKLNEVSIDGDGFVEGVDNAIKIVAEQNALCSANTISALYPLFTQMVVVSEGVLEGHKLQGVRYRSPAHMTGWWLTTDLYNGDIKSLQTIHYYHLAFKRRDLIKYLALPFGYRINLDSNIDIWFDSNADQ